MKTANKWAREFNLLIIKYNKEADKPLGEGVIPAEDIYEIVIKQIQLDAYKAGMTECLDIANKRAITARDTYGIPEQAGCHMVAHLIKVARDNKQVKEIGK